MAELLHSEVAMDEEIQDSCEHRLSSDVPNSTSALSSYGDTDSEDSGSESEGKQTLYLHKLETELSDNPSNYNAHVQYIKCLRKLGHIEKLREARKAMSKLFPLSPSMWQEWANDETRLASSRTEDIQVIEGLYERGVFDYLSISLWCDYLSFVQEHDPSVLELVPEGISKARGMFESAVTAAGSHMTEGSKIWDAYRNFEQAILNKNTDDIEERGKQVLRIRNLFQRQLSVPLIDIESTFCAYKSWVVERENELNSSSSDLGGAVSHISCAYKKALDMVESRAPFEEKISENSKSDAVKLQNFLTYLNYEETSGDPARVQNLFERAVVELPVCSDIWLKYIDFLDRTLKVGNVVLNVYSRAVKNCPWTGELWVRYLLSLERNHASENDISEVFVKSLQCSFSSFVEYLDLFLTRVDGLRRRITGNVEDKMLYCELMRSTFQNASDYLSQHLKNSHSLLKLHRYWAHLELSVASDMNASRRAWECCVKISGSMVECWKAYIEMEINTGHITEARSLFRRCYTKRFLGSGSEDICNSWLLFEREYGTLEDYDYCLHKIRPRLEELQLYKLQHDSIPNSLQMVQVEKHFGNKSHERRKPSSHGEQPSQKRKKSAKANRHIGMEGGFHASISDKALDVEDVNAHGVEEEPERDSASQGTMRYTDKCTVFLSNLSLQATYEHVRNFFSDIGGVLAIRILNDKFTGKSRGLAYVDFWDDAHLAAAVKKNKQILLGKKVSIARSDPSKRRSKEAEQGADVEQGKKSKRGGKSSESMRDAPENAVNVEKHRNEIVNLKGKNTFAVPRNVLPLGRTQKRPEGAEEGNHAPRSNEEFRKLLLKK